jgi:hypothetical protein
VGFYAKSQPRKEFAQSLAYIAKITKVMTYEEYHIHHLSRIDCIYDGKLRQVRNKFHDATHIKRDLSGKNVLLSDHFIFFGDKNMKIDPKYNDMLVGIGHKVNPNDKHKKSFPKYFKKLKNTYHESNVGNHIHRPKTHGKLKVIKSKRNYKRRKRKVEEI